MLLPQLHQVLVQLQAGEKEQDFASAPIQVSISVQLWRLPGCHEFLAALGRMGRPSLTDFFTSIFFKNLFPLVSVGEGWWMLRGLRVFVAVLLCKDGAKILVL